MKISEILGEDAYAKTLAQLNAPKEKKPSDFVRGFSKGREKARKVAGTIARGVDKVLQHPLAKPK